MVTIEANAREEDHDNSVRGVPQAIHSACSSRWRCGDGCSTRTYAGAPTSVQTTPVTAQNGRAVHTYVTHSQSSQGIWLFPPNQAGGGGN
jgi:hypothetical protein